MAAPDDESNYTSLPVVWEGVDELPPQWANMFVVAVLDVEDAVAVSFGAALPPTLLGSREEREAQVAAISHIPVHVLGRFVIPRKRWAEFAALVAQHAPDGSDQ